MTRALPERQRRRDNLTKGEREALKNLRRRTTAGEIVIKPADKDSATVVMTQEDYIVEAMRQLSKEEHYSRLDRDPTPDNTHQIILLLGQMRDRKSINEETWEFLTPLQARTLSAT